MSTQNGNKGRRFDRAFKEEAVRLLHPPLPWTNLSPPFSVVSETGRRSVVRAWHRRQGAIAKFRDIKIGANIRCRLGRVASTCGLRALDCTSYRSDPVSLTIPKSPQFVP